MTNKTLIAAALLTLGAVACDRTDKTSTTNTTSADTPATEITPVPMDSDAGAVREMDTAQQRARTSAGTPITGSGNGTATDNGLTGVNNRGSMTNSGTPMSPNGPQTGTAAPDSTTNVAPGHIMFPPEKGPGTGQPNSNGSHDMGAGGAAPRR